MVQCKCLLRKCPCIDGNPRQIMIHHFLISIQSKSAKIRNRYNQVPHLTQNTNGKVTNSQLDTTNNSQEASPFPASDLKAHIRRRAQRHSKYKTEQKHKRSTKEVPPWNGQLNILLEGLNQFLEASY